MVGFCLVLCMQYQVDVIITKNQQSLSLFIDVTGPDHLAALLPPSIGRSGWNGLRIGTVWGLGHGLSAITLGLCAYFMKGQLLAQHSDLFARLSDLTESVVGVSLVIIGIIGIRESMETQHGDHSTVDVTASFDANSVGTSSGCGTACKSSPSSSSSRTLFVNGLLHGLSWDGAPSLAPALAMTSWRSAAMFLSAYCLGTMVAMSAFACIAGELSLRVGKVASGDPDGLSKKLSLASSGVAVLVGLYWMSQSKLLRG